MATLAPGRLVVAPDGRFFLGAALAMWLVLALGFGTQFATGRSSFGAPAIVHVHAAVFVGWTALYVVQVASAAVLSRRWHRRLGWLSLGLVPLMVVLGIAVTLLAVRRGTVPFFFTPGYFVVMNLVSVLVFAGLTGAALVVRRRRTQWHRRLMTCGMAVLTGPGWARFAPVPLLIPHAGLGVMALVLVFPLAGAIRDRRATGRVHPAWWVGIGTILAAQLVMEVLPRTAAGHAFYAAVTARSPGAALEPDTYPAPPPRVPAPPPGALAS